MGMSDELEVGRYFQRLTAINVQFGTPDHPSVVICRSYECFAEPTSLGQR